ncbi:hypothetical protein [Mycobacterium deserti]|uniref:Uncharacterized protein n=1 Tax=Mycobacterium deserti TaxID=2978347 RepID=A0ABT2MAB9_9MYCO|nr:hypothetical protein [Mycobacterium deserti]MCT7658110.1 hypothetical protein [Mycobacterium deserti]
MQSIVKKLSAGAVMGGALLFTGGMGLASAQPPIIAQDGLVNLNIGDVTVLEDVNVAVVAQVVAQVCDVDVTAAVLGAVDQTGDENTVCTIDGLGPITVTQNGPGNAENAPGAANRPAR